MHLPATFGFVGITWVALAMLEIAAESSPTGGGNAAWDGLKVTFGFNPWRSMNFNALPRTLAEAESSGWKPDVTITCDSGSPFAGNRYKLGNDTAAMLLFDKNGYIAGIQAGIPKGLPGGYPAPNKFDVWIEEPNQWTITAYFVEPSIVCETGRSAKEFDSQGTGTTVIFQAGSNATGNRIEIPSYEPGPNGTAWIKGKCFYMMGMHYWYKMQVDMTEDDFFPAFALYNDGRLNGFGWTFAVNLPGDRYEHPPKASFSLFMQTPPKFLMKLPNEVTTMHVYLTGSPRLNFC